MKFQIITQPLGEMELIATGHTHMAYCTPPAWICGSSIRVRGDSKEDAIDRVIKFLQQAILTSEVTEIDLPLRG